MKLKTTNFVKVLAMVAAITLASCSSDDNAPDAGPDGETPTCTDGVKNGDETGVDCGGSCTACDASEEGTKLTGVLTEERTLDATKTYSLEKSYSIEAGGKLIIPAGTVINATVESGDETETFIVVQKGGEIDVQGTEAAPVTMQSTGGEPGEWGGLVILGDATTTAGVDATAEVSNFKYGGTADDDNSGSIKYLIIKHAGAQINAESQYNGLTLYAVGSGTTIDNVAMIDGEDDGVEFFGGTVSASNLYFENNQDDSIDWTEGWNGTVTNAYVLHTEEGFSTAVEADKDNGNPKLINFTAVSTVGGTALQFKATSGATITGLSLSGYDTSIDMKDDGPLANVIIEGEAGNPESTYNNNASVDVAIFDWVNTDTSAGESSILTGTVTSDRTLDASISYLLSTSLSVESGATLTIPAGTKISAQVESGDETETFIVVQKGGMIMVEGTEANPVVMTSTNGNAGDWGGLVILGDATTTAGVDATAEVSNFKYGGTADDDNSGSITYLIIENAGAQINAESQYNGLTLYAVGSGTTIDNVAMIDGDDDGVEFFGGTVSASNLYFENNQDDSIDWTEGWNGTVTTSYVVHSKEGFSTAVEADKANGNPKLIDFTAVSTVGGTGLQFKATSGATLTNVSLTGYDTNVDMKDAGPLANVIVDETALTTAEDDVFNGTAVDVAIFAWATK
ncbi:hypothetical protein [Zobellia barbeyronii]|uniref:Cyclic nucleotide-binding domain-containing protein n=1 Tax=Zobellia barbeyronii TaxID=2748009 RepID=A0ABS5WAH6_9FLAO|nr:hypothetical protein [Zobellia barbeyronii]MBT2159928.1 hypothetical protein [Zobellia barbeyronii]